MYSAAFGIVNEEDVPVSITYINVSSQNYTYLQIWLHGDRSANANSTINDPTSVLMYDNGTIVNTTNTTAWTLAPGDNDPSDMCSNVGMMGRTALNASDFVWIQIGIDIPNAVDDNGAHTGTIWIHFEADTIS